MEASALQKSVETAMSICKKESDDEQSTSKKKRKKVDLFVFLTDDILIDILKKLPDAFLSYKAKYVCRRWLDLISNMILPDCASFILQEMGDWTARHVGIREEGQGQLQVKVQDLDIPHIGMIRSWGNEFILLSDCKKKKASLYVYNLITKEGSYLPEYDASCGCGGYCSYKCGVALSFDGFKGIYKVVRLFMGPPIEFHILILRRDIVSSKWKKIQIPFMNGGRLSSNRPVSVQGRYFHWDDHRAKRLVSVDVVKEEIVYMSVPLRGYSADFVYTIFEMGGYLALFAGGVCISHNAEIWILKDFHRKEWVKLQSVTLEHWYSRRTPICGVMSNKYIILECKGFRGMCYYDLKNGEVKELDIHIKYDDGCVVHLLPFTSIL